MLVVFLKHMTLESWTDYRHRGLRGQGAHGPEPPILFIYIRFFERAQLKNTKWQQRDVTTNHKKMQNASKMMNSDLKLSKKKQRTKNTQIIQK